MIDLEKIRALYKFSRNIKLGDVQVLIKAAKLKSFAPGAYLIEEGSYDRNVYFIRKGLVRAFKVTDIIFHGHDTATLTINDQSYDLDWR